MCHLVIHWAIVLSLLLVGSSPSASETIGEVLGKPLTRSMLQPSEARVASQQKLLREEGLISWLAEYEQRALRMHVIGTLREAYIAEHKLDATEEEVDSIVAAMGLPPIDPQKELESQRQTIERLLEMARTAESDESRRRAEVAAAWAREHLEELERFTPEQWQARDREGKAFQRQIYRSWVVEWKFSRALWKEFGGRGIYQQGGREPIDAYPAWLRREAAAGRFKIAAPQLSASFWQHFEKRGGVEVPEGDPFATPFWLEKPSE
ncbi:MAG TPA: hypothetical protein PKB10_11730 [Tepidisphaeraceae bacterium]|nr:hypothetical protein [Tepidisphaeraceae bacterium]